MKPSNDREAISLIIDGLIERGVQPIGSRDGEGETLLYADKKSALDWLTSCDDSALDVRLPDGTLTWVYFVLGNDPEEVACDMGVSLSPFIDPIIEPWWE